MLVKALQNERSPVAGFLERSPSVVVFMESFKSTPHEKDGTSVWGVHTVHVCRSLQACPSASPRQLKVMMMEVGLGSRSPTHLHP